MEFYISACHKLADFQSPRFKAIGIVAPPQPSLPKDKHAEVIR